MIRLFLLALSVTACDTPKCLEWKTVEVEKVKKPYCWSAISCAWSTPKIVKTTKKICVKREAPSDTIIPIK